MQFVDWLRFEVRPWVVAAACLSLPTAASSQQRIEVPASDRTIEPALVDVYEIGAYEYLDPAGSFRILTWSEKK